MTPDEIKQYVKAGDAATIAKTVALIEGSQKVYNDGRSGWVMHMQGEHEGRSLCGQTSDLWHAEPAAGTKPSICGVCVRSIMRRAEMQEPTEKEI